ncbi:MAG: carboxypeptidase regulatory-like domain-containing protein [Saprospiraceae bacterium]|nr:carboxypeptidase regulatory-like domain-containing protein [Pyrinomonadaceae bacterium]
MNRYLCLISLAICLGTLNISVSAQTDPAPFDLSTGNFTFTGFAAGTTTTYPANMQGHSFAAEPDTTNLSAAPNADRILVASSVAIATGSIRNEVANGISLLNSASNNIGAVTVGLNTTGRLNITLNFTAQQLNDTITRINGMRAQFRVGTSGTFTDVAGTEYLSLLSGTAGATNFSGFTLPAAANNQPVVQVRWIYYNVSGIGARDRIRLDDITIQSSPAAFSVNSVLDLNDAAVGDGSCDAGAGVCTLRAAVQESNVTSGGQTITFDPLLFSVPQTIILTLGTEITISSDVTISGPAANLLTVDGGPGNSRIFSVNGIVATIAGMTITGGGGLGALSSGNGGAIFANGGTLVLNAVHVTGNTSVTNFGGGLYYFGGINNQINNSTISNNTSGGTCGGFVIEIGGLTVTNSTISGNSATLGGAGFCNNFFSTTTLRNSTITANTAGGGASGGGISTDSSLNLGSTIVAGNTAGTNADINFTAGTVTTAGYNLIGDNSSVAAVFPPGNPNINNDIAGTNAIPVNPLLAPLANYGGPTPTHALEIFPVSPAIDKGLAFGATTDQRGFGRTFDDTNIAPAPGGDNTDIGAYERLSPTAADTSLGGRVVTADGRGIRNAAVIISGGNLPESRRVLTGSFGYYRFDALEAGETYVLSVGSKRYTFSVPARTVTLNDELSNVDFTALP